MSRKGRVWLQNLPNSRVALPGNASPSAHKKWPTVARCIVRGGKARGNSIALQTLPFLDTQTHRSPFCKSQAEEGGDGEGMELCLYHSGRTGNASLALHSAIGKPIHHAHPLASSAVEALSSTCQGPALSGWRDYDRYLGNNQSMLLLRPLSLSLALCGLIR